MRKPAYSCQLCGRPATLGCPGCSALFYCSAKHCRLHAAQGHDKEECVRMKAQRGRTEELQLDWLLWWNSLNGVQEADTATASPGQHPLCSLLQEHRCHGRGIWRQVCPCTPFHSCDEAEQQQPTCSLEPCDCDWLSREQQHGIDGRPCKRPRPQRQSDKQDCSACMEESHAGLDPDQNQSKPLGSSDTMKSPAVDLQGTSIGMHTSELHTPPTASWRHYYHRQGLAAHSPAALALHFALTTFLGLVTVDHLRSGRLLNGGSYRPSMHIPLPLTAAASSACAAPDHTLPGTALDPDHANPSPPPGLHAGGGGPSDPDTVHVLYLGPQAELGMLPTFLALLDLLPRSLSLFMHFIGPDVPGSWHGSERLMERLQPRADCIHSSKLDDVDSLADAAAATAPQSAAPHATSHATANATANETAHASTRAAQPSQRASIPTAVESSGWEAWLKQLTADPEEGCRGGRSRRDSPPAPFAPPDGSGGTVQSSTQADINGARGAEQGARPGGEVCGGRDVGGMASAQQPAPGPPRAPQQQGVLRLSFWQAHLHEVVEALLIRYGMTKENTLVMMPNAGLAAYPSWVPTMRLLLAPAEAPAAARATTEPGALQGAAGEQEGATAASRAGGRMASSSHGAGAAAAAVVSGGRGAAGLACVITDYCEEALIKGQAMLQAACGMQGPLSPVLLNPFRQPYLQTAHGNALPSYSNGFMILINT